MPGHGLDPSWHLVLEHAYLEGWVFGKDLIFTFGPWGFLYPKLFHPQLWGFAIAFELLVVAVWVGFYWRFRSGLSALFLIPLLLSPGLGAERAFMLLPLFAFLLVAIRTPWVWVLPVWIVSAWAANTKFTFLVTALALAVAADLACLSSPRKQWPVHTVTLLCLSIVAFCLAGQPPGAIVPFFRESLDLAAGYGESMNMIGSWAELALFAGVCLAFLGTLAYAWWHHPLGPWRALISWLAVAGVIFILFRGGFTRHDGHSLIAWGGLLGVMAAVAITLPVTSRFRLATPYVFGLLLAALVLGVYFQTSYAKQMTRQSLSLYQAMIVPTVRKAKDLYELHGLADIGVLQQRRAARAAQVLAQFRMETPTGSVDVIPWNGSVPILAGWDFKPRPVFQTYAAYTERQQDNTRRFVEHAGADHIFLTGAEIDRRWPASSLGWSQLSLLSHYDLSAQSALGYHLRRRSQPRSVTVGTSVLGRAQAGEWVDVPSSPGPVVLSAHLDTTGFGRALKIFLNPVVLLEGELADGRVVSHRVLPGVLRAGMVVSPYVTATGLPVLFSNDLTNASLSLPAVKRIRVVVSSLARSMFVDSFQLQFQSVNLYGDVEFPVDQAWSDDLSGDKALELAALAARRWDEGNAKIFKSPTGQSLLDAHAGTRFGFDVMQMQALSLSYGIRPGAWKQGKTNGVRVVISLKTEGAAAITLLDRTLDPASIASDRDQQHFRHQFGEPQAGELRIIVTDNGDPRWDWSYLAAVQFDAARVCVHDNALQCIDAD